MKIKEYNRIDSTHFIENNLVIIVISIIIIILIKPFSVIVANNFKLSAQSSAESIVNSVKTMYIMSNLHEEVNLPFEVRYNKKGYKVYSNNKKYELPETVKVKMKGQMPTSGSIKINTDGTVDINKLVLGKFTCIKNENDEIVCKI